MPTIIVQGPPSLREQEEAAARDQLQLQTPQQEEVSINQARMANKKRVREIRENLQTQSREGETVLAVLQRL